MTALGLPTNIDANGVAGPSGTVGDGELVATSRRLFTAVAHGADLTAIAEILAAGTGTAVAVLGHGHDVLATAGSDPVSSTLPAGPWDGRVAVLTAGSRSVIAPVLAGPEIAGHVVLTGDVVDGPYAEILLAAAEQAALACAVLLARDPVIAAAARSARRDLVEALLLGRPHDDGEIDRWAAHLGHDGRPHTVVAVALAEGGSAADHTTAETAVLRWAPEAIVAARRDEIVLLLPQDLEQAAEVTRRCVEDLGRRGVAVAAAGIGNAYRGAADVSRSYGEARGALAAARRTASAGSVWLFRDLGINRLLLRVPDAGELRAFGEEVIGRLLDEEAASGMPYLATLAAYFEESSSPSAAARRLHVHPNTIAYRLRRIEELTGLRLSVHRDRLMAEVAVEIVAGMGRA